MNSLLIIILLGFIICVYYFMIYEENNNRVAEIGKVRVAIRTVWSTESYQIVRQKLTENSYNIVHKTFFP